MNVNKTIPFVVIRNICNDIKTSFIEFCEDPNLNNSNSFFWYATITILTSLIITICEACYAWPMQLGESHNNLYFNDGPNSVLLWMLTMCICGLICMFGWLIIGFIHWLISSYKKHYYEKYGSPSDELKNYDAE